MDMSNNETPLPQLVTRDINRRDLMKMSELSDRLAEADIIYVNNRGELDAVMMRADKALILLDNNVQSLATAIRDRRKQDTLPTLTDRDISILRALGNLDNARLVEIADAVNRESSNIHRALQNMVDYEMVDRQANDDITYTLTSLGEQVIQDQ